MRLIESEFSEILELIAVFQENRAGVKFLI